MEYPTISCKSLGAFKHVLYAHFKYNVHYYIFCLYFLSWFSFSAWLHIHLASSYLCTQLYSFHIQQTFYKKKKKIRVNLEYTFSVLQATESWVGLGNEARTLTQIHSTVYGKTYNLFHLFRKACSFIGFACEPATDAK